MSKSHDKPILEKILSRYDQLGLIRKQIFEGNATSSKMERLRNQSREKIDEINRHIEEHGFQGPLSQLLKRYQLNKYQLVMILALLRQRLLSSNTHLTGRELLQLVFDGTYDILQGMALIDSSSGFVSTGIITVEPAGRSSNDILESKFRLSDRIVNMIFNTFAETAGAKVKERPTNKNNRNRSPYSNNMSYLMDLRWLSLLYQKRTTKVFNYDYWDEIGLGVAEPVLDINRQMELLRKRISTRLERTKVKDRLYTWKFIREHSLTEEETVILITLLFQEITEGNAYLNAVDLIRLTSQNEKDLIRKRRFFSPRKTLMRNKLVQLEEMVNGKELTAEVCLPNWIIEKMLSGEAGKSSSIDVDARLDFHKYLNNIDSVDDLLDDLDT